MYLKREKGERGKRGKGKLLEKWLGWVGLGSGL
jgi:hypothetical protein